MMLSMNMTDDQSCANISWQGFLPCPNDESFFFTQLNFSYDTIKVFTGTLKSLKNIRSSFKLLKTGK